MNLTKPQAASQLMQRSPVDACSRGLSLRSSPADYLLEGICRTACATSLSARRGALANDLKLTALRPLGFSRTSPYRSKLLTALHEKSPALCAELQIVCGEGGIRTPGASQLNSFQDCRNRPLYHLSSMYPFGEGSAKICNNLLLCKHFPKKDFENLATGAVTPRA